MYSAGRKMTRIGLAAACFITLIGAHSGFQAPGDAERLRERMRALPEGDDEARPPEGACFLGICVAEERQIAGSLVESGPQPGGGGDGAKPSVVGVVRNAWPMVVDFEPEPGTFTVVRVKLYHRRWLFPYYEIAFQQVLDPDGSGGRQTVVVDRLNLADSSGDGIHVARYDVRSFRLADGELVREHGRPVRAPVTVYGMGAGPQAVGSMILLDVRFTTPTTRQVPAQNEVDRVGFSYRLMRDFDAVAAVPRFCNPGCNDRGSRIGPLPRMRSGPVTGSWPIDRHALAGNYELDVRAWLQCGGATAADAFARCADDSAWTFATARPFRLNP